jgi:hypothetical protein
MTAAAAYVKAFFKLPPDLSRPFPCRGVGAGGRLLQMRHRARDIAGRGRRRAQASCAGRAGMDAHCFAIIGRRGLRLPLRHQQVGQKFMRIGEFGIDPSGSPPTAAGLRRNGARAPAPWRSCTG